MTIQRVVLPGKVEMTFRLSRIVSVAEMSREKEFYDALLGLCGKEVDDREIVFFLADTLRKRVSRSNFNISAHLEALLGDNGQDVAASAKAIFERVAIRTARN